MVLAPSFFYCHLFAFHKVFIFAFYLKANLTIRSIPSRLPRNEESKSERWINVTLFESMSVYYSDLQALILIGILGDGYENVKKNNCFNKQNNKFGTYSMLFGTFRRRRCTTITWNFLVQRYLEGVNTRRRIFLSLPKLGCGPQGFIYICQPTFVSKLKQTQKSRKNANLPC